MMRLSLLIFLHVIALARSKNELCSSASGSTHQETYKPAADATLLFNPEKGFYADYYSPGTPTWSEWRKNGISIAVAHYVLKNSGDVDTKIFTTLKNDLENAKKSGMKLGLRFTYGEDTDADAPYGTMQKHISQIQSKLTGYGDAIFVLQAGFIGKWGEWCYSKNFGSCETNPALTDKHYDIAQKCMEAVPNGRQIQLRTVSYRKNFCKRYDCSLVGIYNDCFMGIKSSDKTDADTFKTAAEKTELLTIGQKTLIGGEFCTKSGTDGVAAVSKTCQEVENEIRVQRFTFLNSGVKPSSLKSKTCYNQISNVLGYRFELVSGTFPDKVKVGGTFCATITVKNTGATNLIYNRPVQVVLRSGQQLYKFPISGVDATSWKTGGEQSVQLSFKVTGSLSAGKYDVLLNLPDSSDGDKDPNQQRADYRIIMSNAGVAEDKTRYNKLSTVTVA